MIYLILLLQVTHVKILLQENTNYKEPTSLFEHFIIAGLHSNANLDVVEDAFAKRKKWESDMAEYEVDLKDQSGPSVPTLEPQVDCLIK